MLLARLGGFYFAGSFFRNARLRSDSSSGWQGGYPVGWKAEGSEEETNCRRPKYAHSVYADVFPRRTLCSPIRGAFFFRSPHPLCDGYSSHLGPCVRCRTTTNDVWPKFYVPCMNSGPPLSRHSIRDVVNGR